jgi:hypothetical protein
MDTKIKDCQTIAALTTLERLNTLSEAEQRLVFEKKMEIFQCLYVSSFQPRKRLAFQPSIKEWF